MTSVTSVPLRRNPTLRTWGWVLGTAVMWLIGYALNRPFWHWVAFDLAGLDPQTRLGSAVEVFGYDTTKILLLLTGIILVVTVLRSFMSVERTGLCLGDDGKASAISQPPGWGWRHRSARAVRCRGSSVSSPPGCLWA